MAILEKGYSYTKRLPKRSTKNAEVIVKILDCIPNRRYCASFTSQMDITIVSYDIEVMDAGTIAVTYEENYQLKDAYQLKHRFFRDTLLAKDAQKRGIKLLKHIEHCIIKQQKAGAV